MKKLQNFLIFAVISILCSCLLQINYTNASKASSSIESLKNQFLPPELRNSNLTMDDFKKILREKCKKASGFDNSTYYLEIEVAAKNLTTCFSKLVNMTAVQDEIEAARPLGELDTVFHKYCQKAPALEKCLKHFNSKVQYCLTEPERQQNAVLQRVISSLMGFMCDRGGDQIALFVAEEGPECLEANKEAIANCANQSFAQFIPKDGKIPDLYDLPELVLSPEHCLEFEKFEKCTVGHLEQCQEITPANVAESVFKFVKNETTCHKWINDKLKERPVLRDQRNTAGQSLKVNFAFLLLGGISILFFKYL